MISTLFVFNINNNSSSSKQASFTHNAHFCSSLNSTKKGKQASMRVSERGAVMALL
jgi:hypothetical protein